jgi:hypothetical protein
MGQGSAPEQCGLVGYRLKCRSCRKGRYAPPVHMIKLTEARQTTTRIAGCILMMMIGDSVCGLYSDILSCVYCSPRIRRGSIGGNLSGLRERGPMRKWWIVWPLYAGLIGFVIGASFFFGLYGRNATESSIASKQKQTLPNERYASDERRLV